MPNAETTLVLRFDSAQADQALGTLRHRLLEEFPEASLELIRALHDVADDRALEPTFRLNGVVAAERSHQVIKDRVDQRVYGRRFDCREFDDQTGELGIRERGCSSIQIRPAFGISFALSGLIAWIPREVQRRGDGDKQSSQLQCFRLIAENREKYGPPCKQLDPAKNHGQTTVEACQAQAVSMSQPCLNDQIVTIKNGPGCKGSGHFSPIEIFLAGCLEASDPLVRVLIAPLAEVVRLLLAPPSPLQGFLEGKICLPWSVPCEQVGGVGANILSQEDSTAHIESEDVAEVHIPGDTRTPAAPDAVCIGPLDI